MTLIVDQRSEQETRGRKDSGQRASNHLRSSWSVAKKFVLLTCAITLTVTQILVYRPLIQTLTGHHNEDRRNLFLVDPIGTDAPQKVDDAKVENTPQNTFRGNPSPFDPISAEAQKKANVAELEHTLLTKPPEIFKDGRIEIQRPYMNTTSRTFLDAIFEIERSKYDSTPECDSFGGSKVITTLEESAKSLVNGGTSSVVWFGSELMDIYYAENVSVVLTVPAHRNVDSTDGLALRLELDGTFLDRDTASLMTHNPGTKSPNTILSKMTQGVSVNAHMLDDACSEYIDYPVMLVDDNVDTNNWWFFMKALLNHYIAVAVTQPLFGAGDYKQQDLRVLHTTANWGYLRSFTDAFEFMFSDRRGRDSRQIWNLDTAAIFAAGNDGKERVQRYCFRKLLWTPGASTGADKILINKKHSRDTCFSSIVYAYAANLKASLHIPTLPRPKVPRVVWVGRDTSAKANPTPWQKKRIINNQDEVISYLKNECGKMGVELVVADFYGDKLHTSYQEQALLVSRADVMIGMHGAGLNMFHFMPFNSVVVEIHSGTKEQRNSANYVNHIREGKYMSTNAILNGKRHLKKEPVWDILNQAIGEWHRLA